MDLSSIDTWVFDLDNTLYPASARLFDQIEVKMEDFMVRELGLERERARVMRGDFWHNHGTTLEGLVQTYGIDPTPFLDEVHDIDLSGLDPSPALAGAIGDLGRRAVIYTNGSRTHGENVSKARGIRQCFDAVFGIEDAGYKPKPHKIAFDTVFNIAGIDPARSVMIEDDPRNLKVPAQLGMITILVDSVSTEDHVHHCTNDLEGFLSGVARDGFPAR